MRVARIGGNFTGPQINVVHSSSVPHPQWSTLGGMSATIIVVGADAAGMSAASTIKRAHGDAVEVVVLERGRYTSYAACGLPFWIGGEVTDPDELIARSAAEHRANGIDLRLGVEVVRIDPAQRQVYTDSGEALAYDHLILGTGAEPIRPRLPGIDAEGIYGLQSIPDGQAIIEALEPVDQNVVIVGSGYIGLELAEACVRLGIAVTVIEREPYPMPLLAPELGDVLAQELKEAGVTFVGGEAVEEFQVSAGRVRAVITGDNSYPADVVMLGMGVRARTQLAAAAGLPLGPGQAIVVNQFGQVEGQERVWAAGDCVASTDRLTSGLVHIALGTHANKQGLVVGRAVSKVLANEVPTLAFPGVVRTAITRFCDTEIGICGLATDEATAAGFEPVAVTITAPTKAHYYPGAAPMQVRLISDRKSQLIIGGQVLGPAGAGARIDIIAMAIWNGMKVEDLMMMDLSYAPPFSPVWDPVQTAARVLSTKLTR